MFLRLMFHGKYCNWYKEYLWNSNGVNNAYALKWKHNFKLITFNWVHDLFNVSSDHL